MVTIPVSMYQTVVTNIQNMNEAGIPVTMSALTAAATETQAEDHVNDTTPTTTNADEEVKATINGTQTPAEEEAMSS